jgi:hypothetical protein
MDASKFILPLNVQSVTEKKPTKIVSYLRALGIKNTEHSVKETVTSQLNATPVVTEMEDGVSVSLALFLFMSLADGAFAMYVSGEISSTMFKMMSSWLYADGLITVFVMANGVLYWAKRDECVSGVTRIVHFFMTWVVVIWVIFGWNEFSQMNHHTEIINIHTIYQLLRIHLVFQTLFAVVAVFMSYHIVKNLYDQASMCPGKPVHESVQMKTPVK